MDIVIYSFYLKILYFMPTFYILLLPKVAVRGSHIVALTTDQAVFTWGDGRRGQLGHGEVETWRPRPGKH